MIAPPLAFSQYYVDQGKEREMGRGKGWEGAILMVL